jgi:carboxylesterase type B
VIDPEQKRQTIQKVATWGLIAAGCAIAGPLAYMALEGLVAIVAFGVSVALVANFAPAFGTWLANKKIQALVAVIEANPIETMLNLKMEKEEELNKAADHIRDFEQELNNFRDQVKDVQSQYPEEAESYVDIQKRMEEALGSMKDEQSLATVELKKFAEKIKKAQVLFGMAKAANRMLEKSQTAQEQVFAQIKEQVSFNKVRSDLNRAFANLNSAVERRKNAALLSDQSPKALPEPKVEVIDLGKVGSRVKVER